MISIQSQFLFIHVPKTGGNSIQNILRSYSEDEIVMLAEHQDGIERFGVRNRKYNLTKHSTLSHYKSVMDASTYRSLFKFAVMRNPWDMMISFYFSPHRGIAKWNRDSFLDMLEGVPTIRHYICEEPLRGHQKLDSDIDFLLRFERLEDDFRVACGRIGIPCAPLPHRNKSDRAHYSTYYDDELMEIVHKKFQDEIAFGGYRFEHDRAAE